jgi:hypothetical protein
MKAFIGRAKFVRRVFTIPLLLLNVVLAGAISEFHTNVNKNRGDCAPT